MSDLTVKVMVAVGTAAVGLGVAGAARVRERRRAASAPLDLAGFSGGLLFFSDAGCRRCDQARAILEGSGVTFTEAAFDREPERLRAAGVTAVPLLVGRSADGREVGRIAGKLDRRSLARLVSRMG